MLPNHEERLRYLPLQPHAEVFESSTAMWPVGPVPVILAGAHRLFGILQWPFFYSGTANVGSLYPTEVERRSCTRLSESPSLSCVRAIRHVPSRYFYVSHLILTIDFRSCQSKWALEFGQLVHVLFLTSCSMTTALRSLRSLGARALLQKLPKQSIVKVLVYRF